jgi:predicted transcriptional regulator
MTMKPLESCFDIIKAAGDRGLTDHEISEIMGVSVDRVKQLRRELQLAGRLRRTTDPERRGGKGRLLDVWIANEAPQQRSIDA